VAIHRIKEMGPITLTIISVRDVEGKFGPQMCFEGEGDIAVFMSKPAGERQLTRLGLTPETAVGKSIHFTQTEKNGTTFTNLALVAPGAAAPTPKTVNRMSASEAGALYGECLDQAIAVFGVKCEELGIAIDAQSLHSVAATLFITLNKR
jgi:hypothetical protein